MCREFNDIKMYRKLLEKQTIKSVEISTLGDDGLKITCGNGTVLEFAFSGCEGTIKLQKYYESKR
ncbi:hypothetical protein KAR91_33540 [Candidatus Pacearchaeota archaeon]|nr:hypothetical protein [Candidatus Pacearchaeota archaeon]